MLKKMGNTVCCCVRKSKKETIPKCESRASDRVDPNDVDPKEEEIIIPDQDIEITPKVEEEVEEEVEEKSVSTEEQLEKEPEELKEGPKELEEEEEKEKEEEGKEDVEENSKGEEESEPKDERSQQDLSSHNSSFVSFFTAYTKTEEQPVTDTVNSDSDSGQETPPIVQHKPRGSRVELFIMGVDDMETEEVESRRQSLFEVFLKTIESGTTIVEDAEQQQSSDPNYYKTTANRETLTADDNEVLKTVNADIDLRDDAATESEKDTATVQAELTQGSDDYHGQASYYNGQTKSSDLVQASEDEQTQASDDVQAQASEDEQGQDREDKQEQNKRQSSQDKQDQSLDNEQNQGQSSEDKQEPSSGDKRELSSEDKEPSSNQIPEVEGTQATNEQPNKEAETVTAKKSKRVMFKTEGDERKLDSQPPVSEDNKSDTKSDDSTPTYLFTKSKPLGNS